MPILRQPLGQSMRAFCMQSKRSVLLFSPYITAPALKFVLGDLSGAQVQVVTTWRTADVITGSSNLDVYPEIKSREGFLYLLPNLHMKAVLRDEKDLYLCTANATGRGLGLMPQMNIECGVVQRLNDEDATWFTELIGTAHLVNDELFEAIRAHVAAQPDSIEAAACTEFDLDGWVSTNIVRPNLDPLPRMPDPETFLNEWGNRRRTDSGAPSLLEHDLRLLRLPFSPDRETRPEDQLRMAYFALPCVKCFAEFVERECYFGETRRWVAKNHFAGAERSWSEVTELTRRLYAWTANLAPERFASDRPHYSQRIYTL